ncbi:hypothetical protein PSSHI_10220 [Photobacterium sp. R1]
MNEVLAIAKQKREQGESDRESYMIKEEPAESPQFLHSQVSPVLVRGHTHQTTEHCDKG